MLNLGVHARQRIYCTPVDDERIEIRGACNLRPLDDQAATHFVEAAFHRAFVAELQHDFPVWENKAYLSRPFLVTGDGPIAALRNWAKQFYPV